MKVLFQSRKTIFSAPGGDTIQLLKTKEFIERLGVSVDISIELTPDVSKYDIVHIFNLMRGQETLLQINNARKANKKIALSTIYGLYTDFERYGRDSMSKYLFRALSPFQIEYIKVAARSLLSGELHAGSLALMLKGYRRTLKDIVDQVDVFLPNSDSEMQRVIRDFGLKQPYYEVVPNAVDTAVFDYDKVAVSPEISKYQGCVLSVARIEGRKCQLQLVQALKGTGLKLVLIGKVSKNHKGYYNEILKIADKDVVFIDHLDHDKLPEFYKACKVHALISWMETPGLSSLEAGVMGANLVVTPNGDTRDYFGDMALYCKPDDIQSIRDAILEAYSMPSSPEQRTFIRNNFNWELTAKKTLEAYNKIFHGA